MSGDDKAAWLAQLGVTTVAGSAQAAAGQKALPTIWVTAKGDGSFTVMGTAFNPTANVKLRVVDDALNKVEFDLSADPTGKFTFGTGKICKQEGAIHFSATDSRPNPSDDTGVLWSNTATSSCPAGGGDGKGGDGKGGDGGDGGGGDGGGGGGGGDGGGSDGGGGSSGSGGDGGGDGTSGGDGGGNGSSGGDGGDGSS